MNTGYFPWQNSNPTYSYRDTITKTLRNHTLIFGASSIFAQKNEPSVGLNQGSVTFNTSSAVTTGNAFADLLTARIGQFTQTSAQPKYYNRYKIVEPSSRTTGEPPQANPEPWSSGQSFRDLQGHQRSIRQFRAGRVECGQCTRHRHRRLGHRAGRSDRSRQRECLQRPGPLRHQRCQSWLHVRSPLQPRTPRWFRL